MCRIRAGGCCLRVGGTVWNTLKGDGTKIFKKRGKLGQGMGALSRGGELEHISNYCFKKTPLASSQSGIVIKYLKFKYYRRSGNENICQGICKFGIIGKWKHFCVWDNDQAFCNSEELLCQFMLFDTNLLFEPAIERLHLPNVLTIYFLWFNLLKIWKF